MRESGNAVKNSAKGTARGEAANLVDHGALKSNQLIIVALSLLAFVLDSAALVAGTALVMALGTFLGRPGFHPIYVRVLRPLGLAKPEPLPDNPGPHRFAQGFGSLVLLAGAISLFTGFQLPGWALVWLVIFLAAINAFAGFCAGCFLYYQLGRFGIAGFNQGLPEGARAGFKPSRKGES
jgi:hypothetical protein